VNGFADPTKLLLKGPPIDGDVLILTKGLGTGTILAADMRAKANGSWVYDACKSMLQSNRTAAKIIFESGACSACTDITGFGLLGHLIEMLEFQTGADDVASRTISPSTSFIDLPSSPRGVFTNSDDSISRNIGAKINLSKIPLLNGAAECVKNGVFSTLHPQVNYVFFSLFRYYFF
jgi:selenide,water dikinase